MYCLFYYYVLDKNEKKNSFTLTEIHMYQIICMVNSGYTWSIQKCLVTMLPLYFFIILTS